MTFPDLRHMTRQGRHLFWSTFAGSLDSPADRRGTAQHLRDKHGVEPDMTGGVRSTVRQHAELHGGTVNEDGSIHWASGDDALARKDQAAAEEDAAGQA